VLFLWGSWRVSTINLSINDDIFRIVPTSWAQTDKYRALESRVEHLKELIDLSFVDSKNTPILILWPETTIEFALLQREWGYDFMYPEIKPYLQHMLTSNTLLLAGIVLRTPQDETYNIVFGVSKTGDISYVYKKRFLAPFGEFMPTGLRSIANTLGIHAMDDFNRGTYDQSSLLLSNGLRVNTLICYEGSFSGQVVQPYQSVDLFTVSTNDAWFGYNGKEQQFISHAFRAIEEGVPMIRSANRGFSGYVSPIGTYKVSLSKTPLTLKIHKPLPQQTPYRWLTNRCTYWLELVFSISLIYILTVEIMFRRRKRP
jgi:apolipoprotein N-acyltransferase